MLQKTIGDRIRILEDAGLIKVVSRRKYKKGGVLLYIRYCKDELLRLEKEVAIELKRQKETYLEELKDFEEV